ncbi:hypothetical protein KSF78_0001326 [Schistosoma japonicum]|nr:hypothetical protein KSF78_0001326 [Schistosoma japonicum]
MKLKFDKIEILNQLIHCFNSRYELIVYKISIIIVYGDYKDPFSMQEFQADETIQLASELRKFKEIDGAFEFTSLYHTQNAKR